MMEMWDLVEKVLDLAAAEELDEGEDCVTVLLAEDDAVGMLADLDGDGVVDHVTVVGPDGPPEVFTKDRAQQEWSQAPATWSANGHISEVNSSEDWGMRPSIPPVWGGADCDPRDPKSGWFRVNRT